MTDDPRPASRRLEPADSFDFSKVPEPLGTMAQALAAHGKPVEAFADLLRTLGPKTTAEARVAYCEALRAAFGDHPLIHDITGHSLIAEVQSYHLSMVADRPRNEGYATAIAKCIRPGMIVLEIGTGSGLLSILAAKAGAEHVYTVELRPVMAAIARRNVAQNGVAERVTVLGATSTDLKIGEHLPRRADALLHELFDSRLVVDSLFKFVAHARAELLTPGAVLLPDRAQLHGRLEGRARGHGSFGDVCGVDLSALSLLDSRVTLASPVEDAEPLSAPALLADFDLHQDHPDRNGPFDAQLTVTKDGTAHMLDQWIGYGFPDGTMYENPPGTPSHWARALSLLPDPRAVRAGDNVTLRTHVSGRDLWYELPGP